MGHYTRVICDATLGKTNGGTRRQQAFVLTTLDVILKGALDQAARSASRAEKQ
jgi:hypothetical protein